MDKNNKQKKNLFELANDDIQRKNNDMYDIVEEIPNQSVNVLNTVTDTRDLTLKSGLKTNKTKVEDISISMQIWNKMKRSSFFIFERDSWIRIECKNLKENP